MVENNRLKLEKDFFFFKNSKKEDKRYARKDINLESMDIK